MGIAVTQGHFAGREQAVREIESDGLRLVEVTISPEQLAPEAHTHPYSAEIYLLDGIMELHEPDTGRTYRLEAGTKAVVPAGTMHSETSPAGLRAAIGLSADPRSFDEAAATGSV